MKTIKEVVQSNLQPRVLGFDDAPFATQPRVRGSAVSVIGVLTSRTRFEGMLYGEVGQDLLDATAVLQSMIEECKFLPQIHAVLLDGVTLGGLNVVDLVSLAQGVGRVCVAVMRRQPDLEKMWKAMRHLPEFERRKTLLETAGPIHEVRGWVFQYRCSRAEDYTTPEDVANLLDALTPNGTQKIPECLRVAHLIGSALKTGQSSSSA